ncbi:mucin-5AC [Drosophila guanche]|uniref:Blast:Actin cytoskeleton-regulatory complex protein PAN1 n=1 Tax=Drosophila guanche TaxID=7266 RepID=A0A3B0KTQ5_DROGU|nr:mucin-5AC [Drosophila guanche]SPP88651.1 blast:Actin cytoskeleton-regulatory complex protein PAN1 [Drosophila guanche]
MKTTTRTRTRTTETTFTVRRTMTGKFSMATSILLLCAALLLTKSCGILALSGDGNNQLVQAEPWNDASTTTEGSGWETTTPLPKEETTQAPIEVESTTPEQEGTTPEAETTTSAEQETSAPAEETSTGAPLQPESTTGAPLEPETTTGAPLEPETTTGAPLEPESTTGAPVQPESTTGAPVQPESTTGAPVQPESTTGAPVQPESTTGAPVQPESTTGAPVQPESTTGASNQPDSTTSQAGAGGEPTATTTLTPAPTPPVFECQTAGLFPHIGGDCRRYHNCLWNPLLRLLQEQEGECPPLTAFSPQLGRCVRDVSVCKDDEFECLAVGRYAGHDDTYYYSCMASLQGGLHKFIVRCSSGQRFEPLIRGCWRYDWTQIVPGQESLELSDLAAIKRELKLYKAEEKLRQKALKEQEKQARKQQKLEEQAAKKAAKELAKQQAKAEKEAAKAAKEQAKADKEASKGQSNESNESDE